MTSSRASPLAGALGALLLAGAGGAGAARDPQQPIEGWVAGADDVRLHYRMLGTGPDAVVFLHGGPGLNIADGGYAMDPLAERHRLIMYDQRGAGRSTTVRDTALLTAAAHVRDLEAVRRHFGLERMALIGNSWGAGLALMYATAHPERVSRLVFLSPMPPNSAFARARTDALAALTSTPDRIRLQEIAKIPDSVSDAGLAQLCREVMRIVFKPYLLDSTSWDRQRADVCDEPADAIRNGSRVGAATTRSLGDFDLRPAMARLHIPVLVIEGERSHVPLDATREWVKATPDARLLLIPGSGHAVFLDQPAALVAAIDVFLRGAWPEGARRTSEP